MAMGATDNAMATQYPFLSNILIKSSTDTNHRRSIVLIKALKDSQSDSQQPEIDPVKLALARAKAYKKSIQSNPTPQIPQNPDPVADKSDKNKGFEQSSEFEKTNDPKVSAIDFVGLGFADKKEGRGLPAGLIPISDPFPSGDLPDVEIIVGDTTKFGSEKASNSNATIEEDETELYKPKVSTWGVFPRPNNISKTYGGGKTIRPGEVLETAESKAAKQARTRQMIAAYNRQMGLLIDPKLKAECEKDLKDGDYLMEIGKLKDAIPLYEKVMDKLVYQSELHGLAALQWSICQDSLNRSNEARAMYEKLQSHPNVRVSKKARQFVFSFQAMEMMKVTSSSVSKRKSGYQNFFDAFVENKNSLYATEIEGEEDVVVQALPYVIFLVSPVLMILVIAVQKRLL